MTDVLAQLLTRAQARATLFATARLPPVWGVRFPAGPGAYFHTVHGAEGWLLVDGAAPRRVGADDVVLLTRGSAHRICSGPEGTIRTVFDPVSWQPNVVVPLAGAGGPRAVTLVCGAVRARDRADVLEFLPDVVHVRRDEQGGAELALTLQQLFAETAHPGGSSAELLARLGDVLLLQIVRHWLQNADENAGWLRALRDPHIHQTLVAIHADPAHPWTVAELAARAHLSRSRFTERFTELIGRSPLAYVAGWRLDTAADLLAAGHGVAETAHAVGYGSESGFARAFRRHHGHPPSRARNPAD